MLTVRWNEPNGVSTTMEATRVSAQREIDPDNVDRGRRRVYVDRPNEPMLCIDDGEIFVMNDRGHTVSAYQDLRGAAPPEAA